MSEWNTTIDEALAMLEEQGVEPGHLYVNMKTWKAMGCPKKYETNLGVIPVIPIDQSTPGWEWTLCNRD